MSDLFAKELLYILDGGGAFRPVSEQTAGTRAVTVLEEILRFCSARFEVGTEIAGQIDAGQFLVCCGEGKAAIGLARKGSRPISLRPAVEGALRQAEELSSRGAVQKQAGLQEVTVPRESPFTSIEEISELSFSMTPPPPAVRSTPVASAPVAASANSPSAPVTVSWEEVARFIAAALEGSTDYVGTTVAANYWRQALKNCSVDGVTVDFRGRCKAEAPTKRLSPGQLNSLEQAFDDWSQRCRKVIPEFEKVVEDLDSPPWKSPSVMETNR